MVEGEGYSVAWDSSAKQSVLIGHATRHGRDGTITISGAGPGEAKDSITVTAPAGWKVVFAGGMSGKIQN